MLAKAVSPKLSRLWCSTSRCPDLFSAPFAGPRASVNLDVVFGSAAAAALARDLAMVWRQHCCNQEVEDIHAHERYNYAPSE